MSKATTLKIANSSFIYCILYVAATFSALVSGCDQESTTSYFLVTSQTKERSAFVEVSSTIDGRGCLSLCNKNDKCKAVVYTSESICLMTLNRQEAALDKAIEIGKRENFAFFEKLGRMFDLKSQTFVLGNEEQEVPQPRSCKEIYENNRFASNGNYSVWPDGADGLEENVYCHMTKIPGCDKGGWTLVMKIDGNKPTFMYSSNKWTQKQAYQQSSALEGLDSTEMVSPAYWRSPLSKLCLGMRANNQISWIMVPSIPAQSLHSLLASNKVTNTHLGQEKWKSLLSNPYLVSGCQREGLNVFINNQRVRIGMVAAKSCARPDGSMLGFGSTASVVCGNYHSSSSHGNTRRRAFGYILIQ